MTFDSFIIPEEKLAELSIDIDECNQVRPIQIQEGPDKGKYYLDQDIINRIPQLNDQLEDGKRSSLILKKTLDEDVIRKKFATVAKE